MADRGLLYTASTAEIRRMPLMVKKDETANPSKILLLGPIAIVQGAQATADLFEEARLRIHAAYAGSLIDALVPACSS
jgi:hypothetical protein